MLQPKMNGGGARSRRRDQMIPLPWDIATLPGGPGIPGLPGGASSPLSGWLGPGERGEPVAPPQRGVGPPDVFNILQGAAMGPAPVAPGVAMGPAPADAAWAQLMARAQQRPTPEPTPELGLEGLIGPEWAYRRHYGMADEWLSPFQRWQMGYQPAVHDIFRLQQKMGLFTGQPEGIWEDFLQPFDPLRPPGYGQAAGILGGLFGMTPEQRGEAGIAFSPGRGGEMGQLAHLLFLALRPHLGIHGARALTGRLGPEHERMFRQEALEGREPRTFLDYLRQRFNLQRFGF